MLTLGSDIESGLLICSLKDIRNVFWFVGLAGAHSKRLKCAIWRETQFVCLRKLLFMTSLMSVQSSLLPLDSNTQGLQLPSIRQKMRCHMHLMHNKHSCSNLDMTDVPAWHPVWVWWRWSGCNSRCWACPWGSACWSPTCWASTEHLCGET